MLRLNVNASETTGVSVLFSPIPKTLLSATLTVSVAGRLTPNAGVSANPYVSDKDLDRAYECASVKPKTLVLLESTSVCKGSDKDARSSNDTASVKLLAKLTTLLKDSDMVTVSVFPKLGAKRGTSPIATESSGTTVEKLKAGASCIETVSYTHLTLPTTPYV